MKKLILLFVAIVATLNLNAQCNELFLSEYVEGTSTNKAVEIYNPTGNDIDLSGYVLSRFPNGSNTPFASGGEPASVILSGTIAAKSTFVVVLDKRDPQGTGQNAPIDPALEAAGDLFVCDDYAVCNATYFNGDDAVTLAKTDGTVLDIIGVIGQQPLNFNGLPGGGGEPTGAWTDTSPFWTGLGTYLTQNQTLTRKASVDQGVGTNPTEFDALAEWDSLGVNIFTDLGAHDCVCNTSINDINKVGFNVYPNPVTTNQINIVAESNIERVVIYNKLGQEVYNYSNEIKVNELNLNINNMKMGVYMISVHFENDEQSVDRLIIK